MSFFENRGFATGYFEQFLENLGDTFVDGLTDSFLGSFEEEDSYQINDNFIGNNGAILLTDDAQSTVNFLYINPIEFFNNGRASDITLNISLGDDEGTDSGEQGVASANAETNEDESNSSEDSSAANQFNDNVIGNNAAILMTDDAQSTVNFLYVNPIEFFNNGRASDIHINITAGDETTTQSISSTSIAPEISGAQTESSVEASQASESAANNEVATIFEESDFAFLEELGFSEDFSVEDALSIISEFEFLNPLSFLDDFLFQDEFDFSDTDTNSCNGGSASSSSVGTTSADSSDPSEFNDNVIGNNAAILLTDNATSTVNFLYINPIQFFNDGRAGDIYLDITIDEDDGFFVL